MLEEYILVVVVGTLRNEIDCDHLIKTAPVLTEGDQRKIIEILKGNQPGRPYLVLQMLSG